MYRREKVGSVLLIFSMMTFLFAGISYLVPKINVSFSNADSENDESNGLVGRIIDINYYYLCEKCYFSYESPSPGQLFVTFKFENLTPGLYGIIFNEAILIYNKTSSNSNPLTWYDFLDIDYYNLESGMEFIFVAIPQYKYGIIQLKEIWILDHLIINF